MNPVMLVIPRFYLGSPIATISVFRNMRGGWRYVSRNMELSLT